MELLIALLIAFGITTSKEQAMEIAKDSNATYKVLEENGISQAKIDERTASIIGLEESDM